jgi:hypothetical protein
LFDVISDHFPNLTSEIFRALKNKVVLAVFPQEVRAKCEKKTPELACFGSQRLFYNVYTMGPPSYKWVYKP